MSTATGTTEQLEKLGEASQQTIFNIQSLLDEETKLFVSLQGMDKTPEEKEQIINQINKLSQMRLNLHETLKDVYAYYQSNVAAARTTLGQQLTAMGIIESELNEAKRRLNDIEAKKNSKLRLVQINTYYGKRYNAQKNMLILIVVICVILFIIALLKNRFGLLPSNLAIFLMALTIAFGAIILFSVILDFSNRDNINFDEYNWRFDKSKAPTGEADPNAKNPWSTYAMCVNAQCCDENSDYNTELNKCVLRPAGTAAPVAKDEPSFYTGLSKFAMGVSRAAGNYDVLPMEATNQNKKDEKKEKFSNYAPF